MNVTVVAEVVFSLISIIAGARDILTIGVDTVTVRVALTPDTLAVMTAVPFPTADTSPFEFTVATAVLLDTQFVIGTAELVGLYVTVVAEVVPTFISNVAGVRDMLTIGITSKLLANTFPCILPNPVQLSYPTFAV